MILKSMAAFFNKHFNRALADEEREAITKDFPKPISKALRLDEQVKDQLKKESPTFWGRKVSLQGTGPLTCLWADLLNKSRGHPAADTESLSSPWECLACNNIGKEENSLVQD